MKKLLVIEDDIDTLDIVGMLFATSFEVITYDDLIPIDLVIKIKPDIILLDNALTSGSGLDLCLKIKQHLLTKHIPVIMFSASHGLDQIAIDSCADGYIEKPFNIADIEQILNKLTV